MEKTGTPPFQVRTKRPATDEAVPRLPHERDESDDSQASGPRDDIKRAYEDLMEGQVDTDLRETRGVEEVVKAHRANQPGTAESGASDAVKTRPGKK